MFAQGLGSSVVYVHDITNFVQVLGNSVMYIHDIADFVHMSGIGNRSACQTISLIESLPPVMSRELKPEKQVLRTDSATPQAPELSASHPSR